MLSRFTRSSGKTVAEEEKDAERLVGMVARFARREATLTAAAPLGVAAEEDAEAKDAVETALLEGVLVSKEGVLLPERREEMLVIEPSPRREDRPLA